MTAFACAPLADRVWFQEGPGLRKWQWREKGVKVINGTNIREDGTFDPSNSDKYLDEEECRSRYSHFMISAGDIVLSSSGTLGKIAVVTGAHLPMIMNTSVIRLKTLAPDKLDNGFLLQWLRSRRFLDQILPKATGSAQQNFGPSHLREIEIDVPEIAVQRRIADILSAYDVLIENNSRRIAILEDMARRLFEGWFGDADRGDWPTVKLGTIADINPESLKPKSPPTRIGYIDIASVSPGKVDEIQWLDFTDAPGRARRIVRDGDVIWSNVRPNRRSYALLLNVEADTIVSTGFSVLRAQSVPWSYLYMVTTTRDFTMYLTNRAKGSAYPAVGSEDFGDADLLLPDSETLTRFHGHVGPMLELASCLHVRSSHLRATRDLLLPKLISGEIQVRAAEEALESAAA